MAQVNIHKAKTHFSALLERVHEGEEIIIAKAGKPYARLLPIRDSEPRVPGRYPGTVPDTFFDSLPEDELAVWE